MSPRDAKRRSSLPPPRLGWSSPFRLLLEYRWRIGQVIAVLLAVASLGYIGYRIHRRWRMQKMVIATGTPGAAYAVAGGSIIRATEATMRHAGLGFFERFAASRPPVRLVAKATNGSHENVPLLRSGAAQFALVHSTSVVDASVRAVAKLYDSPMQIVARGRGELRFSDLCGKRLAVGARESTANTYARRIVEHFCPAGVRPTYLELNYREGRLALENGQADAFFITTGLPVPLVEGLLNRGDTQLVSLGDAHEEAGALQGFHVRHPEIKLFTIPARAYGHAPEQAVGTFATSALLAVRADVDEAIVEDLLRAMYEHRPELVIHDPLLAGFELAPPPQTISWHAGALRFYEGRPSDKGWLGVTDIISILGTILSLGFGIRWNRRDHLRVYARRAQEARAMPSPEEQCRQLREVLRALMDDVETEQLPADPRVRLFAADLREEIRELQGVLQSKGGIPVEGWGSLRPPRVPGEEG
jgi:TRAP transporter TAXI family solute receptor